MIPFKNGDPQKPYPIGQHIPYLAHTLYMGVPHGVWTNLAGPSGGSTVILLPLLLLLLLLYYRMRNYCNFIGFFRAVVFHLNLKHLHLKITNLFWVVL